MNLLILGANSDVAYATAQQFAAGIKADLILASRDMALLEKKARDLEIRHDVRARVIGTAAFPNPKANTRPEEGSGLEARFRSTAASGSTAFRADTRILATRGSRKE